MAKEEYEIDNGQHPEVQHFQKSISEIELGKLLARYREISIEIEALEGAKDARRTTLIELGKGEESISAGGFACFFKKVAGRVSTDWKRAYKDAVGEMPSEDVSKYVTKGDETVRI